MNQRCFFTAGAALALIFGFLGSAYAQKAPAPPPGMPPVAPLSIHQVKGHIYEATGGAIANTGFFIGDKEVLAIDAKMTTQATQDLVAEIKKLTPNPIGFVALTHSDRDHVDGIDGFPSTVRVIAHDHARQDLDKAFSQTAQRAFLPSITFTEELDLFLGPDPIRLIHFGPAHTSGDVIVFFPHDKVAFLGDLLFLGRDPLIHREKGGTSVGLVKNLKAILTLDADTYVHGHGDIAGRKEVEALIRSIEDKQAKVQALVAKGKPLDEIKKILKVEEPQVPAGGIRWPSLVEIIYQELTEKK